MIRVSLASAIAAALALPAAALAQQQDGRQQATRQQQATQPHGQPAGPLDPARLYRSGWSAKEMIGTEVRGETGEAIGDVKDIVVDRHGNVSQVVVEVGGFLELGDQHIGVPWKHITFGPDLEWIQVPLAEVTNGTYSLYGRTPAPQGEDVQAEEKTSWRVNELLGDRAALRDIYHYGFVRDVIFDNRGRAQALVVRRGAGVWGGPGWYAYPYYGYYPGEVAYPLPYASGDLAELDEFDYLRLGRESMYSGADRQAATGTSSAGKARAR